MWTLGPALIANLYHNWGELCDLATDERWTMRPEDLTLVTALAGGIEAVDDERRATLQGAIDNGWALECDDTWDPFIAERLATLDRRFAWCSPDAPWREVITRAHASRRHFHRGFGQYAALPETVSRRVALAGTTPKKILVLGDDDFVSLGLAAAGHDVTVLEIDEMIVRLIERLQPAEAKLQINARDLRDPWPTELCEKFDLFFTDPLSGPYALRLFINRGLASLKPDGVGYVCVAEIAGESFETVRRSNDFDVSEHYADFNHYYGPHFEVAPYVSDLLVLRLNAETQILPAPGEQFYAPGLSVEENYSLSPASRYVMHNIDPRLGHLVHIDTAIRVLKEAGQLEVLSEQMHHEDDVRSYLALTKDFVAVHIRVDGQRRIGELFVAPADPELEDSLLACFIGLLKASTVTVQKHRVRNSTLIRMY